MRTFLIAIAAILLVGAAYWLFLPEAKSPETPIPNTGTETLKDGEILSLDIEPSTSEGGWTMYKDGAKVVLMGKNLKTVKIKTLPTGTGMGEIYPDGVDIGDMNLSPGEDSVQVWELEMRKNIMAVDLWAEAIDDKGNLIMSENFGSVGYEE